MTSGDDSDGSDFAEKTNIFRGETLKIKLDPNYKVPPCLVLLVGPVEQMGRQWLIDKPGVIMGRSPTANVHVNENSLSKIHAKFDLSKGKVTITDLGATNGTLVNDHRLKADKAYPLKNNDQIRAGSLVFKFLERGILSETKEKERMQSELETARVVQETLFPKDQEATYQWAKIGGLYRSATECGGDWWWHWSCADRAFAIIGDATGHGAAAALITSAARSAIATVENDTSVGIEKVYTTLSHAIHKCSGGKLSMSAFIVEVNLQTRKLRYINASHLPAVVLKKKTATLIWRNLDHLMGQVSPSLGSSSEGYSVGETTAAPNTRLVLLTDGLTERKDDAGIPLNERLFYSMLIEAHSSHVNSQNEFLNSLLNLSEKNASSAAADDDITVVALDFN